MNSAAVKIDKKELLFDGKALYKLIWPLFVEQLLAVLVGMVDVIMVSSCGEAAVSGVSLIDSINVLLIQMFLAIASGGGVIIARYVGAKDTKGAKHASAQLISILLTASIISTIILIVFGKDLLGLIFGKIEDDVRESALIYLRYTVASFPFLALYASGASIFRAMGNTKISMFCSATANICNALGNAFLIYVMKIGVAGVAIATLFSRGLGALIIIATLQAGKVKDSLKIDSFKELRFDRKEIHEILSIGIPNGVESCIFQFGKIGLQSLVTSLGTASMAAYAIASNLVNFLYLPGNALGSGSLTIVGQCYGAKKKEQSKYYMNKLLKMNYIILIVLSSAIIFGRKFILGFYNLSDEAAVLASGLLFIHSIAMVMWPVAFLIPYYFRAVGLAKFTMIVSVSVMWIFRVGLAYIFIKLLSFNVLGIWYAMFADWVVRTLIFIPVYIKHQD